jgi:hypothetical protein
MHVALSVHAARPPGAACSGRPDPQKGAAMSTTADEQRTEWTYASLANLPAVISVRVADSILGIGATNGKQLRASGNYPIELLPGLGRHQKISTARLFEYLGYVPAGLALPTGSEPRTDRE